MSLESKTLQSILQDRALMFKAVRTFFEQKGVLEVDTPILSKSAPIDAYIDILTTQATPTQPGYFHSSPEYGMKKLLAQGLGDIFQLSHVFRQGEVGTCHQIEFSMLEWYRSNFSFDMLVLETKALIEVFLGQLPYKHTTYAQVLHSCFGIDLLQAPLAKLQSLACEKGFSSDSLDRDVYLSFLWDIAEESLDKELTCVTHFPASLAALAKTFQEHGNNYAARFEFYYKGIELANGYHELTDPQEQLKRLKEQNKKRESLGKSPLPLDLDFVQALENLKSQEFYGVAVGFDRLMMLRHNQDHIEKILPLGWNS
jgi:lysyl-tRNA synthetase class 2